MQANNYGERHNTRTNGQHYTAADRRPTNQVSAWQTGAASVTVCVCHVGVHIPKEKRHELST